MSSTDDEESRHTGTMLMISGATIRGEWQVVADTLLEAALACPSKWDTYRWWYFDSFGSMVCRLEDYRGLEMTPAYRQALKRLHNDETEPILFRSQSLYTLGHTVGAEKSIYIYEKEANYFRALADVASKISAEELHRRVRVSPSDASETALVQDLLEEIVNETKGIVSELENPNNFRCYTPRGQADRGLPTRLAVGGGKCDCCGKKRAEVQDGLLRCTRCKLAYYCSSECQNRQWKAGHKKTCRARDQIEPGDYMTVHGLVSRPELNERLAEVVGPDENSPGRWQVHVTGLSNPISVASEKLSHVRPAK